MALRAAPARDVPTSMLRRSPLLLAALCAAVLPPAVAASAALAEPPAQPLQLDGRPTSFRDGTGVATGCALRIFGVEALPLPRDLYRTVDVSLLVTVDSFTRGVGVIKASSYEATAAAVREGRPGLDFRITDAWLRLPGAERTQPLPGKPPAAGRPQSLSYSTAARPLLDVADAALDGRPVEVGLTRDGPGQAVFVGVPAFEPAAKADFVACMRELTARARALPR